MVFSSTPSSPHRCPPSPSILFVFGFSGAFPSASSYQHHHISIIVSASSSSPSSCSPSSLPHLYLPTLSVSDFSSSEHAKTYLSPLGSFKISKMFSTLVQVSSGCSHLHRSPGKRWHIAQIFLIAVLLLLLLHHYHHHRCSRSLNYIILSSFCFRRS